MINSRRKGKRIELDAVHYLHALGFPSARRGQQHRGGSDSPDVIVDELPGVHIEVKGVAGMDVGTKALDDALAQSEREAAPGQIAVVLWRPNRKPWRMTWRLCGQRVTACGDESVKWLLLTMNKSKAASERSAA